MNFNTARGLLIVAAAVSALSIAACEKKADDSTAAANAAANNATSNSASANDAANSAANSAASANAANPGGSTAPAPKS